MGDVLNQRYRLNAQLGEGGFAIAFAGQDMEKKQAIAVKVLKFSSEKDIVHFSEEAYLMVDLEHPNIVPFVDYVPMREGIRPYIVMKLAPRGSLKEEMRVRKKRGEQVPLMRSIFLLDQAGAGLEYIHGKGIVHRDIKPENLLLASENELWLSDFGIAKQLLEGDPSNTRIIGTPHYMAPEQIQGRPEIASDQYALAITAYELFTGRRPFTGGSVYEVMNNQLNETPLNLAQAVQNLNKEGISIKVIMALDSVVMRALAKEPDKRHASVTLFTKTLRDEYEQASGEKADSTVFEAVKPEQGRRQVSVEERKKKEVNAFLQKGVAFYDQKNYEEAIAAFDQAIRLDPNDNFAFNIKGLALYELGRNEEAIAAFDQAIRLDPNNSAAYNNKGASLDELGRGEEAIAAYDQAIWIDPNISVVYNNEGDALYELKRYEEAIAAFDQAIRIDPNDITAYNKKSAALNGLERYEEALVACDQAIRIDPNDSVAYNNKGAALNGLKRYEEAIAACDQAIRIDPNDITAYNKKSAALNELKRYEEALVACDQAIRIDPNDSVAYNKKSAALNGLKRYEEALVACDQAIRIDPNNSVAYNNKGDALYVLLMYQEALDAYNQAIKLLDPETDDWVFMQAHNKRGKALLTLGNYKEAIQLYNNVILFHPKDSTAYTNKGIALNELGRYEEALLAFNEAIRLNPNFTNAYYNKGIVLNALGRYEEALEACKKAEELDPSDTHVKSRRGTLEKTIKKKNKIGFFKRLLGR